jgi:hypothetical protein
MSFIKIHLILFKIVIHTLCPFLFNSFNILSNRTIFPQEVTRSSSILYSSSAVRGYSNRYGWLQHFLNCIIMFCRRTVICAVFGVTILFLKYGIMVFLYCLKIKNITVFGVMILFLQNGIIFVYCLKIKNITVYWGQYFIPII